jgi:hypothetical protein
LFNKRQREPLIEIFKFIADFLEAKTMPANDLKNRLGFHSFFQVAVKYADMAGLFHAGMGP